MYNEAHRQLREESQLRQDIENELMVQVGMKHEIELAMKLLEKDIHEKQDTLINLRLQLEEVKVINTEMYQKLQSIEQKHYVLKPSVLPKVDLNYTRLQQAEKAHMEADSEDKKVKQDYMNKSETLQKEIAQKENQVSKLKIEDIKEANKTLQGLVWLKDKEATHCKLCEKEFSLSKRKHHCRNCGEIFCNACSDNELPLPSSPKPVRVCDSCHALLIQRCSSNIP
ncbi:hypothetical protein Chor_013813 [Crotalus horridus]